MNVLQDKSDKAQANDAEPAKADGGNDQALQLVAQSNGDAEVLRALVKPLTGSMREAVIREIHRLFGNSVVQQVLDANADAPKPPAGPVPVPYPNVAAPDPVQQQPQQAENTRGDEPGATGGGVIAGGNQDAWNQRGTT